MAIARKRAENEHNGFVIITGAGFTPTLRHLVSNPDFPELSEEEYIPFDLTGYAGRMDIRKGATRGSDLIVSLSTENGGITLGGTLGTIKLFIDNTITNGSAGVTPDNPSLIPDCIGTAYYDLFLIPPTGSGLEPIQILIGTIQIVESVSDV